MFCSPPRYNLKISIHALLAESDRTGAPQLVVVSTFLSTLSLRRATSGRPETRRSCAISIHALLAESDRGYDLGGRVCQGFLSTLSLRRATLRQSTAKISSFVFLSTLSLRRATAQRFSTLHNILISIHALLAESDNLAAGGYIIGQHFYPRSPCGERQKFPCIDF